MDKSFNSQRKKLFSFVSVGTWNVLIDGIENRVNHFPHFLCDVRTSILLLQEATPTVVTYLAEELKYPFFSYRKEFGECYFGVLSDFEIEEICVSDSVDVSGMPRTDAVFYKIGGETLSLLIGNAHLPFIPYVWTLQKNQPNQEQLEYIDVQTKSLQSVINSIESCRIDLSYRKSVIIAGDLNFGPDSSQYRLLLRKGWINACKDVNFPTVSYPSPLNRLVRLESNVTMTLDYQFFKGSIFPISRTHTHSKTLTMSDHALLTAAYGVLND